MTSKYKEVKSFGEIFQKKSSNTRALYEHQKSAMHCLDIIDKQSSYSMEEAAKHGAYPCSECIH